MAQSARKEIFKFERNHLLHFENWRFFFILYFVSLFDFCLSTYLIKILKIVSSPFPLPIRSCPPKSITRVGVESRSPRRLILATLGDVDRISMQILKKKGGEGGGKKKSSFNRGNLGQILARCKSYERKKEENQKKKKKKEKERKKENKKAPFIHTV